jgi:chemotaxis protein CheC
VDPLQRLAAFQLDVLKEVGNIGAGHAATALSQLLGRPVDMKIPLVRILSFEQIADSLGGSEAVVVAIFLRVDGGAPGNMFFILSLPSAKKLLDQMVGIPATDPNSFTEMEISALQEIGNILVGSYLSSLADFTGLQFVPTVPSMAIDMAGAILSFGLIQFGQMGDRALLIDTAFLEGEYEVAGHFYFIPDPQSFDRLFNALGVPLE